MTAPPDLWDDLLASVVLRLWHGGLDTHAIAEQINRQLRFRGVHCGLTEADISRALWRAFYEQTRSTRRKGDQRALSAR